VLRRVICITSDTPALKGGVTPTGIYWLMCWAHGSHQKEMQIKDTAALWSQLLFSLRPIKMEEKQNADDRPAARFIIFVWM
jgi:hypothetical protein